MGWIKTRWNSRNSKNAQEQVKAFEKETESEKKSLQEDTDNSIKTLEGIVKKIKSFENGINNEFKKIKVSNLQEVEFKFEISEQFISVLKDWSNIGDGIDLEHYEHFFNKVNEFLIGIKSNNNTIDIKDLIKNIKYEIVYEDGSRSETQQSNGTETMINIK